MSETISLNSVFKASSNLGSNVTYPVVDWPQTNYDYWHTYYEPLVTYHYPDYVTYWADHSKIETTFKVLQVLMDLKLIKIDKVKDFIEAVNKVAEALPK